MRIAYSVLGAAFVLFLLVLPLAAQETVEYADTRYVAGADDTLGHVLILTLRPDGIASAAELRIYEGPPEPTVRIALAVRTGGRRLVLQGRHPDRGLLTVAGTRTDTELRGSIQQNEDPPKPIHLLRKRD